MITSWRIVSSEFAGDAFSGKGASLYPGRWNESGSAVVYTAQSAALGALEILVHIDSEQSLGDYMLFACTFPEEFVESPKSLPKNWKADPPPPELRELGFDWLRKAEHAVLKVPSVIVDTEYNYLLNPAHPEFQKIEIAAPLPFNLDMRLLRR